MPISSLIGNIFMVIGVIFIAIGIYGLYKFKDFYVRALIASLIDTAGFISLSIGLLFYHQASYFTLKIGIIIVLMILLNPLSTHTIARSAHLSYREESKEDEHA